MTKQQQNFDIDTQKYASAPMTWKTWLTLALVLLGTAIIVLVVHAAMGNLAQGLGFAGLLFAGAVVAGVVAGIKVLSAR